MDANRIEKSDGLIFVNRETPTLASRRDLDKSEFTASQLLLNKRTRLTAPLASLSGLESMEDEV